jgi:hypothetical protein
MRSDCVSADVITGCQRDGLRTQKVTKTWERISSQWQEGFERWDKLLSAMKLATHWYAWRRGMCFILERESWTVCEYLCQVVRLAWVCTIHVDSETVFSIPYSICACTFFALVGGRNVPLVGGKFWLLTINWCITVCRTKYSTKYMGTYTITVKFVCWRITQYNGLLG